MRAVHPDAIEAGEETSATDLARVGAAYLQNKQIRLSLVRGYADAQGCYAN